MEKSGSVKNSNTIKTMTPVIEIEHISKRYGKPKPYTMYLLRYNVENFSA